MHDDSNRIDLSTASALAGVSIWTLQRAVSSGEISSQRRAQTTFDRAEIEEFARRRAARQRKSQSSQPRMVEVIGEPSSGR